MFNKPSSLRNRLNVFAALASLFARKDGKPLVTSPCQTQFFGVMRRNPLKMPGNAGNNAGRNRPHQGARECARRRGDLYKDRDAKRYADAA